MKWEYLSLGLDPQSVRVNRWRTNGQFDESLTGKGSAEVLNKIGLDGWELVAVVVAKRNTAGPSYVLESAIEATGATYYFKRPLS
jgi:hypothetical protein